MSQYDWCYRKSGTDLIDGTEGMEIMEQMDSIKLNEVMEPMELNVLYIAAGT